jgi:hypothetical protein
MIWRIGSIGIMVQVSIGGFTMALTIVALLLFLVMVAAWAMLPGSMMALPMEESADPIPANVAPANAASQTV